MLRFTPFFLIGENHWIKEGGNYLTVEIGRGTWKTLNVLHKCRAKCWSILKYVLVSLISRKKVMNEWLVGLSKGKLNMGVIKYANKAWWMVVAFLFNTMVKTSSFLLIYIILNLLCMQSKIAKNHEKSCQNLQHNLLANLLLFF